MIKSCKDSFILRFHLKSPLAGELLDANPKYERKSVVILQTMIVGDMEVLCELINKDDYEKLYEVAE